MMLLSLRVVDGRNQPKRGSLGSKRAVHHIQRIVLTLPAGQYVRRLKVACLYNVDDHPVGWQYVLDVLPLCPFIEHFHFLSSDATPNARRRVIQILERLPRTLRALTIESRNWSYPRSVMIRDLSPYVMTFKQLVSLEFLTGVHQSLDVTLDDPSDLPSIRLPLVSLSIIYYDPSVSSSFARLELPELRCLNLRGVDDHIATALMDFMCSYGPQLICLSMSLSVSSSSSREVLDLLRSCPNLEDVSFSIPTTCLYEPEVFGQLTRVRRLGLASPWRVQEPHTMEREGFEDKAVDFLNSFCLPMFPNTEILRWVGAEGPYWNALLLPLWGKFVEVLATRGIRFENCRGDLFGTNGVPRLLFPEQLLHDTGRIAEQVREEGEEEGNTTAPLNSVVKNERE